jgi:hypothetical protein
MDAVEMSTCNLSSAGIPAYMNLGFAETISMDATCCKMHKKMAITRIAEENKEEIGMANRQSVTIEGDAYPEQFVNCNWTGLQGMLLFDLHCSPLRIRFHGMKDCLLRAMMSKTN